MEEVLELTNYLQPSEQKKLQVFFQSFSKKIDNVVLFHIFLHELIIVEVHVHKLEITA